ncbi:dTDP-4-dehydrorhamnose reductase [Paenibacillus sophorae]|uniref:dTDP-4-dehydrorhamnose reductase n=1 Tax=Paenibacillus sophorae TaxID=1333845 RepID=A0A1H8QB59_9BACL|nr:SDR family oxidoreductase [Paenibacillus sophorae]QWU15200.1 SDR family oxidoreductase [Paenibacillus sophorae]SEO51248.1 dTDP-4-dehydrorhamnose reductase [Paenibacillus sophorae]
MKLLILGGNGMAGHMLADYFRLQGKHQVFHTTRDKSDQQGLILDADDIAAVERTVSIVSPHCIINALGVLNQSAEDHKIAAYHINGFLPHRLRRAADTVSARLIHISTDCVFEGTRGGYTEEEVPDGTSVYAITKALGEVRDFGHLTIRTSIIGPEIRKAGIGLMEWFLAQSGKVPGYRRVMWNGVTTLELAKAIDCLLKSQVSGLIHLAHPQPVSKYELLVMIQEAFHKTNTEIVPEDVHVQDRTLVSTRPDAVFRLPSYPDMLAELAEWMQQSRRYS